MANNTNNIRTGVIDIPGALRPLGGADASTNLVGGVVAYTGDIYDVTAGKNQATLNAEFASGIANAGISDVQVKNAPASSYTTIVASGIAKIDLSGFVSQGDGGGTALTTSEHRSGSYSEAISLPRAIGLGSVSSGDDCIAFGKASTAIGCNTIAIGDNSFVAGRNGFNYSELPVFNKATYLQDGYIGIAYSGPYEVTRGMVMVFRDENYLISEYEPITNVEYGPYDGANTSWSGRDCLKLYYDTSHTIDVPTYLEVSTASLGRNSIGLGYNTVAANEGEVAVGCCNITHGGLTNAEKTMFSVGIGVDKILDSTLDDVFKNAFEVMWDGSIYVKGIGDYNGTSLANVDTLQDVITDVNTRLAALESSSSSSAPTYSAGTGISISNNTISVDTSALNYNQLSNKPIEQDPNGGYAVFSILGNYASGVESFAEGYATGAEGDYSHAEGEGTISFGQGSHAEGKNTKSTGQDSHAEGYLSLAIGHQSHAEGECGYAIGENSHVEGSCLKGRIRVSRDYTSGSTTLYTYDPVETNSLISLYDESTDSMLQQRSMVTNVVELSNSDEYEVTLGSGFTRSISSPTIVVNHGVAYGEGSHAEGCGTSAMGVGSHTEGHSTVANNAYEHASGTYNVSNPIPQGLSSGGTIFSIGGGSADNSRMNIFEALDNGNVYITGIGNYDGTNALTQGVKSVQEVIEELTLQIAALTNN